jgi:hypothetical protein
MAAISPVCYTSKSGGPTVIPNGIDVTIPSLRVVVKYMNYCATFSPDSVAPDVPYAPAVLVNDPPP